MYEKVKKKSIIFLILKCERKFLDWVVSGKFDTWLSNTSGMYSKDWISTSS